MRSSFRTFLLAAGALIVWVAPAAALDPNTKDPRAILQAAFDAQARAQSSSRMKMSIRDQAGTRERMMAVRTKRYPDARKTLIVIEQPADVRNTGFLTIDYQSASKNDEQWLYLPKLHRVTRVPSSGKADSFVGSDFSISDLSPKNADGYEVKMVEESVTAGDETCWLIEATPRNRVAKEETGYERTQVWVSKSKLLPIQLKAWLVGGKKIKYFKAADIRKDGDGWTAHRMQMRTLEGSNVASETLLEVLSVDSEGKDIKDSDFTQQRLEQGV
jgi:outer membrane lipoprotein-sorting protein